MEINFLTGQAEGRSSRYAGHTCVNMYPVLYTQAEDPAVQMILAPTPGTDLITTFNGQCHGLLNYNNLIYCIFGNTFYSYDPNSNTSKALGTIDNPKPIIKMIPGGDLAHNNAYIFICNGISSYVFAPASGTLTKITSSFLGADSGAYLDGTWFALYNGVVQYSDLNNPLSWQSLSIIASGYQGDKFKALATIKEDIYFISDTAIQVYYATGDNNSPFARRPYAELHYGISNINSIALIDNSLIFVTSSKNNENNIIRVSGNSIQALGTETINYDLFTNNAIDTAFACTYFDRGHNFYQLNIPALKKSYVYDLESKLWHVKTSATLSTSGYLIDTHIASFTAAYGSDVYCANWNYNNLYKFNANTYTDAGNPIFRKFETKNFENQQDYIAISRIQINLEPGLTSNFDYPFPTIVLEVSKDGGKTYGYEKWRSLGATGNYQQRVIWHALGISRNWKLKFKITDPVPFTIGKIIAHGTFGAAQ